MFASCSLAKFVLGSCAGFGRDGFYRSSRGGCGLWLAGSDTVVHARLANQVLAGSGETSEPAGESARSDRGVDALEPRAGSVIDRRACIARIRFLGHCPAGGLCGYLEWLFLPAIKNPLRGFIGGDADTTTRVVPNWQEP